MIERQTGLAKSAETSCLSGYLIQDGFEIVEWGGQTDLVSIRMDREQDESRSATAGYRCCSNSCRIRLEFGLVLSENFERNSEYGRRH